MANRLKNGITVSVIASALITLAASAAPAVLVPGAPVVAHVPTFAVKFHVETVALFAKDLEQLVAQMKAVTTVAQATALAAKLKTEMPAIEAHTKTYLAAYPHLGESLRTGVTSPNVLAAKNLLPAITANGTELDVQMARIKVLRSGPGNSVSRLSGCFASQFRLKSRTQEQGHDEENETQPLRQFQGQGGTGGTTG